MSVRTLRTLNELFLRDDGRLEPAEAQRVVDASRDLATVSAEERTELHSIAASSRTTLEARNVIESFLDRPPSSVAPPMTVIAGADVSSFDDDRLVLGPDGAEAGTSGVTPYTRSYDAVREGPMREAHGSRAPRSAVLTDEENDHVAAQSPAAALDAMARLRGVRSRFVELANAKSSFNPEAPAWWGKCHAWAWSALSNELSARVDVGGPVGERGLWLSGQWISRADLGNFMMGVADTIAIADSQQLFKDHLTATDLLQATAQYLLEGGEGFVADIHNDAAHGGDREVWNQPFVAADVDTHTLEGAGAAAVLALAAVDGTPGVRAKHVHVVGRYGNERSNDWEGDWGEASRSWNVYAVTNAQGEVVAAYMADDARLEGARGLPTRASHELPEYVWKPTLDSVKAAFSGEPLRALDADAHAKEYRFFVDTVLERGVPGAMRAGFEAAMARLPAGNIQAADVRALLTEFRGVSEAYTPQQWERAFASRGLSAKAFAARDDFQ